MPPGNGPCAFVIAASPVMRRGITATLTDAGWDVVDGPGDPTVGLDGASLVVWDFPAAVSVADIGRVRESVGGAPILVMVDSITPELLAELVAAGASGAVDRDIDESGLAQAARAVADGRVVVNAGSRQEGAAGRSPSLTRRESQVLALICTGRTNHEIAEALVISENTVKNHVRRLYEKLQVRSRTEAVVRAARWGLVRIDADDPVPGPALPAGPS